MNTLARKLPGTVRTYPASRLAAFTFLTPMFGVAFGGLLLGEPIRPPLLVAVAMIAAGIYPVNRSVSAQR
jgi:drug/metabolite transporter (DMT)-like permease